ncbi:hypothetical protein CD351_01515 [Erythrobacter sp. KY5]|uniref:peptidoglycan editing factor PgeF n=1 Tax=Erythrobacter sp. KY5 TaxID=2011159 RepID=UPI000DBF37AB|nr:peptidoglycan editing factor PgeF [Erythrobacter sp. KY5]AWW73098.1 hypothetical protein CD351_01515 [Erythrobacter sp. KY5]
MADGGGPASAKGTPFDIARSDMLEGVPHGFFGHAGGVHQFGYGGPGTAREVREVRAAAANAIRTGAPLMAPHQVHSPEVVTIGTPGTRKWPDEELGRPVADAVVTRRHDVVIGIVTADCGPILFADAEGGVIGAAHAGWRGAHNGVLENTLAAMEALGAKRERIAAALGPTIAQQSYEVDSAFRDHFDASHDQFFASAPTREDKVRWHFDLPAYILARLRAAGLSQVGWVGSDTHSSDERYYSYRRASQAGAPTYGRQLSAIALPRG